MFWLKVSNKKSHLKKKVDQKLIRFEFYINLVKCFNKKLGSVRQLSCACKSSCAMALQNWSNSLWAGCLSRKQQSFYIFDTFRKKSVNNFHIGRESDVLHPPTSQSTWNTKTKRRRRAFVVVMPTATKDFNIADGCRPRGFTFKLTANL